MTVENPSLDGEHIPLTDQTTNKKQDIRQHTLSQKQIVILTASKFNLLFVLQNL
jgi:hypothetical protein